MLKFLYISGFHKKNGNEPNFSNKPNIKGKKKKNICKNE